MGSRGSFFTALGVLCCFALFVCLTLLASFFLPSHLSFKNMYMYILGLVFGVIGGFITPAFSCRGFESHPRQFPTRGSFFTALGVLCCFALFVCLTLLASFFPPSHLSFVYTRFGVWCHWWFHYPGLLLHTELMVSLFIRCTMRCEIWAQPAELPR